MMTEPAEVAESCSRQADALTESAARSWPPQADASTEPAEAGSRSPSRLADAPMMEVAAALREA
jgi:hypothetical protein